MSKKEVIKSSWIIHISHQLSLVQQQIWNVLLAYAYDNLTTKQIHYLDVRVLLSYLGKTRNISHLKIALQQLCIIESYNLINKAQAEPIKKEFSLLASAAIEDGFCKYSFSPALIPQLINPSSYAKIDLFMQKKFKSKYSLVIYELCIDYVRVDRTPNFTLDVLKKYLGIAPHEYKEFKHFNYKIIKKAILEINQKADLSIAVKFDTKNGNDIVWFTIKKKTRATIDVKKLIAKSKGQTKSMQITECPFQQLKNYGVSHQKALDILKIFSPLEIQLKINEVKRDIKKVCDPGALLASMFNTKKPKPGAKLKCAIKCGDYDFELNDLRVKHKEFIQARVQKAWDNLPDDRRSTLDISFEHWLAAQPFRLIFVGSDVSYRQAFLEETLLTPQERNFERWMKNWKE